MANSIIGTHGSIGPGWTLVRSLNQPHWNSITSTPYAAPIDSRFMMTALSGTSSDRNTTISSRNDRMSTAPKKYGMRSAR